MGKIHLGGFLVLTFIFFLSFTEASQVELEEDLQKSLHQSRAIVATIQKKLAMQHRKDVSIVKEITQLKSISDSEDIRASHLLLLERFRLREEAVRGLGTKALERHRVMAKVYRKAIEEYLVLVDSLSSQDSVDSMQVIIEKLRLLLDKIVLKKKNPILGNLPYKNLNYPSREPDTNPPIKPAYKGGNKIVSPDDTKNTEEAPISKQITELAQSLNWNPVSIYEYVKNNIETEWY